MIVTELEDFATYWNNHCIRKNSGTEAPSGIPTDMFDMPEEFGKKIISLPRVYIIVM